MSDEIESDMELYFTIQVKFTHSSMSAEAISRALERRADRMWSVGDPRATPTGRVLGGSRKETYWTYTEVVRGKRRFFAEVLKVIQTYSTHENFLASFRKNGGVTSIILGLSGKNDIGDLLKADEIKRIRSSGFEIGAEVFPNL